MVGETGRAVTIRAKELYTTGVPEPFIIEYKEYFEDCKRAELMVKSWFILNGFLYNPNREFFEVPLNALIQKIKEEKKEEFKKNKLLEGHVKTFEVKRILIMA
ncbi:GIY-YIG nuclease family protein [Neobacillus cucumis]|uniref:GIY-YIG nuclease family protein n=1 Tax=Neobacillus cucumis TaxID=1740721 RepID=UPI002852FF4F|nr:GIY-YIG nuclease family protein [Neobacillus cucumis]MDR4946473.1 GIY-YIG nuclease family protein [Neobacillus cucumis]